MSLNYVVDHSQRCIFVWLSDVVEDWELGNGAQHIWADTDFDPHYVRLIDGTTAVEIRAGLGMVHAIAEDVRLKSGNVALVCSSEAVGAVFNEYVSALTGVLARVFDDIASAAAWLDIQLPTPWPPVFAKMASA
jgi:hypothetical protein